MHKKIWCHTLTLACIIHIVAYTALEPRNLSPTFCLEIGMPLAERVVICDLKA